jgi:hypothetical protein
VVVVVLLLLLLLRWCGAVVWCGGVVGATGGARSLPQGMGILPCVQQHPSI